MRTIEEDILAVVVAWRAYGKDNAQKVFNDICVKRNLKKFEQVMLADKIIKAL